MNKFNTDWGSFPVNELQVKLKERGLPSTGIKSDLVARLERYDKDRRPAAVTPPRPYRPIYSGSGGRGRQQSNFNTNDSPAERLRSDASASSPYSRQRDRAQTPPPFNAPRGPRSIFGQSPRSGSNSTLMADNLREAELEAICRENFCRLEFDSKGFQREANIRTEFKVKVDDLYDKKCEAIRKLETKYLKDITSLEKDRDEKLKALADEIHSRAEKSKKWGPAFHELKDLRAARGLDTRPVDFDPASKPLRPYSISELAATASVGSASTSGPLKRKSSISQSNDSLSKRSRVDDSPDLPVRPLAEAKPEIKETVSKALGISTSPPYIFLSGPGIQVDQDGIKHIEALLAKREYEYTRIQVCDGGYVISFENTEKGKLHAKACRTWYDGTPLLGKVMHLKLCTYE